MSKKKKETQDEILEEEVVVEEVPELTELELLQEENKKLIAEVEQLKNDYLKAYADTENTKKRLVRENDVSRKYRAQSFAFSILPVIDNLERALSADSSDASLKEGVQMIYDQLIASLKEEGVVAIEALNNEFDPNLHSAMMTEVVEGVEPNIVVMELQKGYMIKDRILRASLVKVSE
ncbi:MAG TPA: nucleotide exchange factor GrpE [Erysipelothrix sp.]|nr:nucleotide exchange factor GrpE [Erysipelothrix sp.]